MPAGGPESRVGTPKKRNKGPRPKRIPQRMCISCRERSAKRTLIRVVRTPEGSVEIDPHGKMNGRGAYLCDDPACWRRALSGEALARALKIETLPEAAAERLSQFAAALPPIATDQPDDEAQQGGNE
ncbi:MAG: YlxR family protein [Thermomicrobiales bacterium]|nr:YlxR family protein [Thermomicrobiales bacterium]